MAQAPYRHLTSRIDEGILVLTVTETNLQGETLAGNLLQELLDAVAQSAVYKVVVDLRHIQYMSSVAFRPLLGLRGKVREMDGRMLLCGLNSAVGDIFYTTQMLSPSGSFAAPFQMEPDVATAVHRLNQETP